MIRTGVTAIAVALASSTGALAHPGHPSFDPNHTHAVSAVDPLAALLLAVGAVAVLVTARVAMRRRPARLRLKK